jgi:hypothetical protein
MAAGDGRPPELGAYFGQKLYVAHELLKGGQHEN